MSEEDIVLFIAKRNGRFTKRFTNIFDMKSAKIVLKNHKLMILPKTRKIADITIDFNQISKILRYKPKFIPYYEIVLLNGEKFYISFYTFWGASSKKLHNKFLTILDENFGYSMDSDKKQIIKKEKVVFQNDEYCYYGAEIAPDKILNQKISLKLTEKALKIWDKRTKQIILNIPLFDIELFLENVILKEKNLQSDKINHKIILKNGKIIYITFKDETELKQDLQANFNIAMNVVLSNLKHESS